MTLAQRSVLVNTFYTISVVCVLLGVAGVVATFVFSVPSEHTDIDPKTFATIVLPGPAPRSWEAVIVLALFCVVPPALLAIVTAWIATFIRAGGRASASR